VSALGAKLQAVRIGLDGAIRSVEDRHDVEGFRGVFDGLR
jgi:hypothetical protein